MHASISSPQGLTSTSEPSVALNELRLYRFYYQMYLIRRVEETLLDLETQDLLAGSVQTAIGQEARDVGVINALDNMRDIIFANHSAHGQFIAYTDDILGLIAEIMGKEIGISGGVGGSQHLHKFNMYTSGMQSGIVLNAVGAALAAKLKGTGAISVVFGTIYESFNIASLWSLPILFVLRDENYFSNRDDKSEFVSRTIVADDVFKVYAFASAAVAYVRGNQSPFLLNLPYFPQKDALRKISQQLTAQVRQPIEAFVEERVEDAVVTATRARPQMFESFRRKWTRI